MMSLNKLGHCNACTQSDSHLLPAFGWAISLVSLSLIYPFLDWLVHRELMLKIRCWRSFSILGISSSLKLKLQPHFLSNQYHSYVAEFPWCSQSSVYMLMSDSRNSILCRYIYLQTCQNYLGSVALIYIHILILFVSVELWLMELAALRNWLQQCTLGMVQGMGVLRRGKRISSRVAGVV